MNTIETRDTSAQVHAYAKKVKESVEFMLKRYPEELFDIENRDKLFDKIISDFTPDERRVIACGQFIENGNRKGKLNFAMPATAKVISMISKNNPSFESGFFKAIIVHKVTNSEVPDGTVREIVTTCVTYSPTTTEE